MIVDLSISSSENQSYISLQVYALGFEKQDFYIHAAADAGLYIQKGG